MNNYKRINMTAYSTDRSDSQWQVIKTYIADNRKRKHSLREVFNAIIYPC